MISDAVERQRKRKEERRRKKQSTEAKLKAKKLKRKKEKQVALKEKWKGFKSNIDWSKPNFEDRELSTEEIENDIVVCHLKNAIKEGYEFVSARFAKPIPQPGRAPKTILEMTIAHTESGKKQSFSYNYNRWHRDLS